MNISCASRRWKALQREETVNRAADVALLIFYNVKNIQQYKHIMANSISSNMITEEIMHIICSMYFSQRQWQTLPTFLTPSKELGTSLQESELGELNTNYLRWDSPLNYQCGEIQATSLLVEDVSLCNSWMTEMNLHRQAQSLQIKDGRHERGNNVMGRTWFSTWKPLRATGLIKVNVLLMS